jgi:hypothetical protein
LKRGADGQRVSDYTLQKEAHEAQEANKKNIDALDKDGKLAQNTDAFLRLKEQYNLIDDIQDLQLQKKDLKPNSKEAKDIDNQISDIQDRMLANQAYDAFDNGNAEYLKGFFEDISKLTPEEVETKGLDKANYKERANEAINYIGDLERAYNESRLFANTNDVYQNRAYSAALKKNKRALDKSLAQMQSLAVEELGVFDITPEFENGKVIIEDYKANPKEAIDNLPSILGYKDVAENLSIIKNNQVELAKQYKELTSAAKQAEIEKQIKEARRERKKAQQENNVRQNNQKNKQKKRKVVNTIKEEDNSVTPPQDQITEPTQAQPKPQPTAEPESTPQPKPATASPSQPAPKQPTAQTPPRS